MDRYVEAFEEAFEVDKDQVQRFSRDNTAQWDSIGHMRLIAALEDKFEVEFEPEEMIDIISFEKGIIILKNKGIEI